MTRSDLIYLGVFFAGSLALHMKGRSRSYHPKTMMTVHGRRMSTARYIFLSRAKRALKTAIIKPIVIVYVWWGDLRGRYVDYSA